MCLPHLKDFIKKTNAVVYCGMSNIGILLENAIVPDYMCVYDCRDLPYDKRFGLDSLKDVLAEIPLITMPEINRSMIEFWPGNIYMFMRGTAARDHHIYTHYLMEFLPLVYVRNPFLPKKLKLGLFNIGCVANIEAVAAAQLGADQIYLVGVNYGYPDNKLHVNPAVKDGEGWKNTDYLQDEEILDEMLSREIYSDDGTLTDLTNVMYKLALLTIWANSPQEFIEVSVNDKWGILELIPRMDMQDFLETGDFPPATTIPDRREKMKEYYDSHGYTPNDFKPPEGDKLHLYEEKIAGDMQTNIMTLTELIELRTRAGLEVKDYETHLEKLVDNFQDTFGSRPKTKPEEEIPGIPQKVIEKLSKGMDSQEEYYKKRIFVLERQLSDALNVTISDDIKKPSISERLVKWWKGLS
jgi:hypothetical protein